MGAAAALIAFIAVTVLSALFLTPLRWPFGFISWIIVVAASLFTLVRWHAANTVYFCPECGQAFSIGTVEDLVSPHGLGRDGGWKLLTCPRCGKHVRAKASMKRT